MYQPAFPQYAQPYGTVQYQQPSMPPQQMAQQPTMPRGITGRMVGAPSEIVPQEVPMDGTVAFFPTSDGSAIFAKAWNPDGTISTVQYSPIRPEGKAEDAEQPTLIDIMSQLDDMADMIRGMSQQKPAAKKSTRKADDDDSQR